jgi:hypothetical protein
MNSKDKNIKGLYRGINESATATNLDVTQYRVGMVICLPDSHNILNMWKNYSRLLNVHKFSDVMQIQINTTEL